MEFLDEFETTDVKSSRKTKDVKDFFGNEYVNFASYDNLRKIASYVDGLKNSSRKVIYTILDKNITNEYKVQRLTSLVSEHTEFIHGETNLEGVICNLAQNFVGSNNLNILYPEGNFGTRFSPTPSASRYIYTFKEKAIDFIFRKEDFDILEIQKFEGSNIEPKYFIPIIPFVLINGSLGVSPGFAQKILPRDPKEIVSILEDYLNGKELPTKILPFYKNFKGTIFSDDLSHRVKGAFERNGRGTIIITELPVGYNLKTYKKVLKELLEKKVIKKYKDLSEDDCFRFEVSVSLDFMKLEDEKIIDKLKLYKPSTENFTTIDENLKIRVFKNEIELLKDYIDIRLKLYKKRKEFRLVSLEKEINFLQDRLKFIQYKIDDKIIIDKRSKENVAKQCEEYGIKFFEDHMRLNLFSLTEEKIIELGKELAKVEKEYDTLQKTKIETIWKKELRELKKFL